jgi:SAM-dependent methyltransferase
MLELFDAGNSREKTVRMSSGTGVGDSEQKSSKPPYETTTSADYAASHDRRLADRSSYLWSNHSLVEELIAEIRLRLDPGASVLEVGCGGGHTAAALHSLGFTVTATDFSETALTAAGESYPEISFIRADATDLGFEDNSFDAVIAVELIEHLADPERHIKEVRRVLRDRGVYFIKTPNRLLHDLYYRGTPEINRWHPSVMSARELEKRLVSEGFKVRFVPTRRLPDYQIKKAEAKFGPAAKLLVPVLKAVPINWLPIGMQPSLICAAVKQS